MGELAIRRNRGYGVARQPETGRTGKTAGPEKSRRAAVPGATVSETLQQKMGGVRLAEARESRRTLQTGEAALAEVQDRLERMEDLAKEAGTAGADREALQTAVKQLAEQVDRMLSSAAAGDLALFPEGGAAEGVDLLLAVLTGGRAGGVPDWLTDAMDGTLRPDQLLSMLGVDKNASGAELLEAIANAPLDKSSAASRLAALYLGSVIMKGSPFGPVDAEEALRGLEKLLARVESGVPLDEAIKDLTEGTFQSMEEFQAEFTGGTALGMGDFLASFLLSGEGILDPDPDLLLAFMMGFGMMDIDLGTGLGLMDLLQLPSFLPGMGPTPQEAGQNTPDPASAQEQAAEARTFGPAEALGRDLSGVSYDEKSNTLTVGGRADIALRPEGAASVRLTGQGAVVLVRAEGTAIAAESPAARLLALGAALLGEVRLGQGSTLTLTGSRLVQMAALRGGAESVFRLSAGTAAAVGTGDERAAVTVPVVLEGPASFAAQAVQVRDAAGRPLEPFDVVWKALLPGWTRITSVEIDGRQAKMALLQGEPARLWLDKGERGHPIHTLAFRGKDREGNDRTRYAYLHWNQQGQAFEELLMYPNPFTVTGGEMGRDWVYEEETQTLRILSARVTAVSGGAGTDAGKGLFCGRMALADGIGAMTLTLGGVECRTVFGSAFSLGRENDVTLLLQNGTENCFEGGPGFAGIALGDGTALRIDCPDADGGRIPAGAVVASGGPGGAGIGRDSGCGEDRTSRIVICGGVVTASGTGGGAGIGAGKGGCFGTVEILGGTVSASGARGGAGIGAGLTAAVGEIHIRGGRITAVASSHAAAIGAGLRGDCGAVRISGTARILRAVGGNPGADIGGCVFGACGEVQVSGAADIGQARLWSGEDGQADTLPQFRLSGRALGLDHVRVDTLAAARATSQTLQAARYWVTSIQQAYGALHARLEPQTAFHRRSAVMEELLGSTRQSAAQALRSHSGQGAEDVRQLLGRPEQ